MNNEQALTDFGPKESQKRESERDSNRSHLFDEILQAPMTKNVLPQDNRPTQENKDDLKLPALSLDSEKAPTKPITEEKKEPISKKDAGAEVPDLVLQEKNPLDKQTDEPTKQKSEQEKGEKLPSIENPKEISDKTLKTEQDIEKEAKLLNDIAKRFLYGNDEEGAFAQWKNELDKLGGANNLDVIKKVFEKVTELNQGLNPLNSSVRLTNHSDGTTMISLSPSITRGLFTMNHRFLAAIIDDSSFFAVASKNDWKASELRAFQHR